MMSKSIGRALRRALLAIVLCELVLRLVLHEPPMPWLPAPFRIAERSAMRSLQAVPSESGVLTTWLRCRYVTARKAPGTYRIVFCGSSAVYGTGVPITASIPWLLERALQQAVPARRWEVVNLGQQGMSSVVHAINVREAVASLDPDLLVVMIGNNEFLPILEYRSRFPEYDSRADSTDRLSRQSYLYGTLYRLVMRGLQTPRVIKNHQVGLTRIDVHDKRLVEQVYRRNLAEICGIARERGAQVVLCTVPVNRQWRPFSIGSVLDSPLQTQLDEARNLRTGGQPQPALDIAAALDAQVQNEFVTHERGLCLAALGRSDEAREVLDQALLLDRHPRRASPRFAAIVQEVGSQCGVPVCDLAAELDARTPARMAGEAEFIDQCHFTPSGARKVATILTEFLMRGQLLPGASGSASPGAAPATSAVPSLEQWPGYQDYFQHSNSPANLRQLAAQHSAVPRFSRKLPHVALAECTSADEARLYGHILAADDDVEGALACYLRCIELTPAPTSSHFLEAGLMAVIGGRFALAKKLLQKADRYDGTASRLLQLAAAMAHDDALPPLPAVVPHERNINLQHPSTSCQHLAASHRPPR